MGGLWIHPIKLVDGFWAAVRDSSSGREAELSDGRPARHLPLRHPSRATSPCSTASRSSASSSAPTAGRRDRPLSTQEHDRSGEAPGPRPHRQDRAQPGVVLGEDRHHRCARHRRRGGPAIASSSAGTRGTTGTSCGAPPKRAMARPVTPRMSPDGRHRRHGTARLPRRGRRRPHRRPDIHLRRIRRQRSRRAPHLPLSRRESRAAAGEETAALRRAAPAGQGARPRHPAAAGLRLGPDQHGMAGQGRSGHRPRARGRPDGVSLVVRHRDLLSPGPHGDRRLRARRSRPSACSGATRTDQRQRTDRPRDHHRGGDLQSRQQPGDGAVHHDGREAGGLERRSRASRGRCTPR